MYTYYNNVRGQQKRIIISGHRNLFNNHMVHYVQSRLVLQQRKIQTILQCVIKSVDTTDCLTCGITSVPFIILNKS